MLVIAATLVVAAILVVQTTTLVATMAVVAIVMVAMAVAVAMMVPEAEWMRRTKAEVMSAADMARWSRGCSSSENPTTHQGSK